MCVCVMLCSSINRSVSCASQSSINTIPTPLASGRESENAIGAAWYSGPVQRCMSSPGRYSLIESSLVLATAAVAPGVGAAARLAMSRVTPFGRPVVPDVYSICPPGTGSSMLAPSSAASAVLVGLVPLDVSADREADGGERRSARGVGRALCVTRVGDDDLRFAVVDDVARFLAGEVPVDRREAVTTATGTPPTPRRTRDGCDT